MSTDNVVNLPTTDEAFERLRRSGDGGHDGGMPPDLAARVTALEGKVDSLAADMRSVKADTQKLREDVAEIKGRLTNMPTLFQIQTWFFGVSLGLVALVFTIARAMK